MSEELIEQVEEVLERNWDDSRDQIGRIARQVCQLFPKTEDNPDGYEPEPEEGVE